MNINLNKCLMILLFLPMPLWAAWSGVNLSIGDETIPLISDGQALTLTPSKIKLEVEDKTTQGLRIGASIAKMGASLNGASLNTESSGEALGLYVYFPYQFNQVLGIVGRFDLSSNNVAQNSNDETGIEYLSKTVSLGISLRLNSFRLMPSLNARSISGDFSDRVNNSSLSFKQKQTRYTSLIVDYFVEEHSFIRLAFSEHSDNTFSISFATVY